MAGTRNRGLTQMKMFIYYLNKETMNKEPLSATNLVLYCKSLISMCRVTNSSKTKKILDSSRISKSRPLESVPSSNWQPTMLNESYKGKRRKGDPVSFSKNRGPCRGGGTLCMAPPKFFKTPIIVGRNRSHTFSFKSWTPYEKNLAPPPIRSHKNAPSQIPTFHLFDFSFHSLE